MKKALIIILIVLVVLVGGFCGLYFFTDTFNFLTPANKSFATQAKKLVNNDEKKQKYSEYEKFLNKLKIQNKSYTANSDINMNLSLPSTSIDSSIQNSLNKTDINTKTSFDANTKTNYADIKLKNDNKDLLDFQLTKKGNTVSINEQDIYDKTLNFDLSKYDEFCKNNNLKSDEDISNFIKALTNSDNSEYQDIIYDLFYLSEDQYNSLQKTYGDLITDLINKDNFSTKKNQKVKVNGKSINTKANVLTLSGEDTYDFIHKFLEKAKNDDQTKKIIVDKYNIIRKFYNENYLKNMQNSTSISSSVSANLNTKSNTELPEISEDKIEQYIDEAIKSLEKEEDEFKDIKKYFKFTIYSKKNEPVKFEIAVLDGKKDKKENVIFTEELSKGKTKYNFDIEKLQKAFTDEDSDYEEDEDSEDNESSNSTLNSTNSLNRSLNRKYSDSTGITGLNKSAKSTADSVEEKLENLAESISDFTIVDEYEKSNDSKKGTITISASSDDKNEDLLKIEYDTINSDKEFKTNFSITSPLESSLKLDYTFDLTGLNEDKQNLKFEVNGKYSIYSAKVGVTSDIEYNKTDIPNITANNSVDVFSLSQDDYNKLLTDINTKATSTLPNKFKTYGITLTDVEITGVIYSIFPQPQGGAQQPATTDATQQVQPAA